MKYSRKNSNSKFNLYGINFPASVKDVAKFEKLNPTVSVNVLGYEKEVYPLRISKNANDQTVNLLLKMGGPFCNPKIWKWLKTVVNRC